MMEQETSDLVSFVGLDGREKQCASHFNVTES